MTQSFGRFGYAMLAAGLLSGCGGGQPAAIGPVEIGHNDYCALDGMTLAEYPGPKAQIHYAHGEPELYCDTVEMFAVYLQPEIQRKPTGIYVHDMGKNDWHAPRGEWIDARSALYVVGSNRRGSMGPTLASFADERDANKFASEYGGKVVRFDEVTPDMVTLDGGVLKDRHG